MSFSTARTAAAIFVAGSLVCLLQGCGSAPPSATVECDAKFGLKKGCSVTMTCSDPPTLKASSECPEKAVFGEDQGNQGSQDNVANCKKALKDKATLSQVFDGLCGLMHMMDMLSPQSVLMDATRDSMEESPSGTLEEKALYMLLGGFTVVALYLAVRGVRACRGTQEARVMKTAMEQSEMPQLSVAA